MTPKFTGIDHIVLTVSDIEASIRWYGEVLGMHCTLSGGRWEARFGAHKINFHRRPGEFLPAAARPTEGSADICLIVEGGMDSLLAFLREKNADIVEGPVRRNGALGPMMSLYLRDPDGNLIEAGVYD